MTKRLIDLFVSITVLIFCLPIISIILCLSMLFTGESPLIFQERRIAMEKKSVRIIKIRTIKNKTPDNSGSGKIFIKNELKDFVPVFCRWLRKSGLDEILQLVNVIKGEMSLIGPRPLMEDDLHFIKNYEPGYYLKRAKIKSKPGISGFWQIYGDRGKGTQNLVELDEFYEKNKSIFLDLHIIIKTFYILLTASHSDAIIHSTEKTDMYTQPIYE